ncbi:MAG TPA: phosphatase PAP2 family protein [Thermoanaerobaculia bacterium]|nr:phosphatase PAP2 family protein [Thermoanaerobaculia bacterium]
MSKPLAGGLVLVGVVSLLAGAARAQDVQEQPPPDVQETSPSPPDAVLPQSPPPEQPAPRPESGDPPFFKLLFKDMGHVLASPVHWSGGEWAITFVTIGGAAGVSTQDDEVYAWAKKQTGAWRDLADSGEWFGTWYGVLGLLGGFYVEGAIFHDTKAKRVCIDGLIAAGIADGLITSVIATGVGRERPDKNEGAYKFRPFHGRSFPSGHVTTMFALASVISASYDYSPVVSVLAYGTALAGSYARLRKGAHFLSDELVAAVIGQAVGNTVVHYNRGVRAGYAEERARKRRFAVMPFVPDGGGVGIRVTLTD